MSDTLPGFEDAEFSFSSERYNAQFVYYPFLTDPGADPTIEKGCFNPLTPTPVIKRLIGLYTGEDDHNWDFYREEYGNRLEKNLKKILGTKYLFVLKIGSCGTDSAHKWIYLWNAKIYAVNLTTTKVTAAFPISIELRLRFNIDTYKQADLDQELLPLLIDAYHERINKLFGQKFNLKPNIYYSGPELYKKSVYN